MVLSGSPLRPLPPHDARPSPVAIVTGSSQGLGLAIALRLAGDGCDVVINDLPSKIRAMDEAVQRIELRGSRAAAVAADVSREDEVKRLVEVTAGKFGKLDIVRLPLFLKHQIDSRLTDCFVCRWWRTQVWWL